MRRMTRSIAAWVMTAGILLGFTAKAQQLPQYTQFALNPFLFNPALSGTEDFTYVQSGFRSQWTGFNGAPKTGYLTAHAPLNKKTIGYNQSEKKFAGETWMSLGGSFQHDQAGPITQSSGLVSMAYNMPIANHGWRFSIGASVGYKSFSFDPEGFLDNVNDLNDPLLQSAYNVGGMDLAAGVFVYNRNYFIGFSSFQLLENGINNEEVSQGSPDNRLLRHYFAMVGLKIDIHRDLFVVPTLLVKSIPQLPTSFDVSAKFVYRENYWFGGSYRNQDALSAFAGLLIKNRLEVSYSYDLIISGIGNGAWGSNEISLGYRLFIKKKALCPAQFW